MNNDFISFSQSHLEKWINNKFNPVFLFVNSEGKIENIHGNFNDYGFDITIGKPASDCLDFLETAFPFQGIDLNLERIKTPNNLYAEVNLLPYKNGVFVFIHNGTKQALEIQEIQQNRNELCLTMNKIKDMLFEINY